MKGRRKENIARLDVFWLRMQKKNSFNLTRRGSQELDDKGRNLKVLLCLLSPLQSLKKAVTEGNLNVIHGLSLVSFSLVYRMR